MMKKNDERRGRDKIVEIVLSKKAKEKKKGKEKIKEAFFFFF